MTPLSDDEPDVGIVDCHYPLIHRSNSVPCHFLHGFPADLNERLGLRIRVTEFKGDIHLTEAEKAGDFGTFWLLVSGGKFDFTTKWWDHARISVVRRRCGSSYG